jgi:hypothetical protein
LRSIRIGLTTFPGGSAGPWGPSAENCGCLVRRQRDQATGLRRRIWRCIINAADDAGRAERGSFEHDAVNGIGGMFSDVRANPAGSTTGRGGEARLVAARRPVGLA